MTITIILFLKISIILVTIIYLITINSTRKTKTKKTFKSNDIGHFTAFETSENSISDEKALKYLQV
jgi:uncharacterized membrane protein